MQLKFYLKKRHVLARTVLIVCTKQSMAKKVFIVSILSYPVRNIAVVFTLDSRNLLLHNVVANSRK